MFPPRGVRAGLIRSVGGAWLIYHMIGVTFANLSKGTVVRADAHAWFSPYTSFLGLWQEWDMFTTIPFYAAITPSLVAKGKDGSKQAFGPMLPALGSASDSLRLTSVFSRIVWGRSTFGVHARLWEQAACDAVEDRTGIRPRSVNVQLDTLRLQPLNQVRRSGKTATPQQFSSPDAYCVKRKP